MRDQETHIGSVIDAPPQPIRFTGTDEGMSIGDVVRPLAQHGWFILGCGIMCVMLSVVYGKLRAPIYEATSVLMIDPDRAASLAMTDRPTALPSSPGEALHTEVVILRGDDVAIRTLNSLNAEEFERFTGSHKRSTPIPEDVQDLSREQQEWISKLEEEVTVKQIDGTELISVTARDKDPRIAAALDNALIRAYAVQTFEDRAHSVAQLRTWLSGQMDELKRHVEESQTKLADFEQANEVVSTIGASNTIADRLHYLGERLSTAQSERIVKEAQMRAARGGSSSELATLFPNPKLSTLQAAQGTLYAQYAQLSSKFGSNYPPLLDLAKQMRRIDVEISSEVQSVRERLSMDFDGAKRAQDMLQAEYDKQTALAYQFNRNQAEYAVLQGDVAASKELYDALRHKLQQATVDTEVNGLNTVLVQAARVPMESAGPKKPVIVLGGLVVGLFAGIISAFTFEATSGRVHDSQLVERELGLPILARISGGHVESRQERDAIGSPFVPGRLSAEGADTVRALRNSLILDGRIKTVLIAGVDGVEGVSPIVTHLAALLAHSGAKVLLVDTEMSKPIVPGEPGEDSEVGLGEYLAGESKEPKPTQPVAHMQTLFMVTGGSAASSSCDLLASAKFRSLLLEWRKSFDYVVVSSSPLSGANVGTLLAGWVDTTVLVAQEGQSRVRELKLVRDTLQRNKARIHGVVLRAKSRRSAQRERSARKETRYVYPELAKRTQTAD